MTWNQIAELLANALGVQAQIVHIPSEVIASYDAAWAADVRETRVPFSNGSDHYILGDQIRVSYLMNVVTGLARR